MSTLRDLQNGMHAAFVMIKERDDTIKELKARMLEKDDAISSLAKELQMLKAVLENPLSETPASKVAEIKKRIAISAAPIALETIADSKSYAKGLEYVVLHSLPFRLNFFQVFHFD